VRVGVGVRVRVRVGEGEGLLLALTLTHTHPPSPLPGSPLFMDSTGNVISSVLVEQLAIPYDEIVFSSFISFSR